MCGIAGWIGPSNGEILTKVRDAIRHRGPDEGRSFFDSQVSFGHRRLNIVDLATGGQPMFSQDRTRVLTFNGEIYNHPKLRLELEGKGHVYKTTSDTESILHAYEEWGTECVKHIDGMFAFVLYDMRNSTVFGARDRFGKKPLYYTNRPMGNGAEQIPFAFSSELKALRQIPEVEKRLTLSHKAVASYLLNDYVLGEQSIFDQITRLPAAHAFTFGLEGAKKKGFRSWRYWDIAIGPANGNRYHEKYNEPELIDRVLQSFQEAVHKRLMSDVPVGTFLSGGIDSTAIVAILARLLPGKEIKTYSIGFDEPSFDESMYSDQVAQHFGTNHSSRRFTVQEMLARLPLVIASLDEPFADPSILPVSLLSEFAAEHVKVALGGDGGDELFAGYDPFRAVGPGRLYNAVVPNFLHRGLIRPIASLLPASHQNMSLGFKVSRFLRGAKSRAAMRPAVWMSPFDPTELGLLAPALREKVDFEALAAPIIEASEKLAAVGGDELDRSLDFFERFYLTDDILFKVDRASMMHSLEVRCPYLDTDLAELVNAVPNHWKLRGRTTKYIFKKAVTDPRHGPLIPEAIAKRKKKGFGIPVARWIRSELAEMFRSTLLEPAPTGLDFFDRKRIELLLKQHQSATHNHYKELWAIFMLLEWGKRHL